MPQSLKDAPPVDFVAAPGADAQRDWPVVVDVRSLPDEARSGRLPADACSVVPDHVIPSPRSTLKRPAVTTSPHLPLCARATPLPSLNPIPETSRAAWSDTFRPAGRTDSWV